MTSPTQHIQSSWSDYHAKRRQEEQQRIEAADRQRRAEQADANRQQSNR